MPRRLSQTIIGKTVNLYHRGFGPSAIAATLGISYNSAYNIIHRYVGDYDPSKVRSGRPGNNNNAKPDNNNSSAKPDNDNNNNNNNTPKQDLLLTMPVSIRLHVQTVAEVERFANKQNVPLGAAIEMLLRKALGS
jgi:transposase